MNERIREFQKQSSIEQWDYDNGCYRYILNPEKFAELIVRECVEVVKWTPSLFPNDEYVKNIKTHFGVEE